MSAGSRRATNCSLILQHAAESTGSRVYSGSFVFGRAHAKVKGVVKAKAAVMVTYSVARRESKTQTNLAYATPNSVLVDAACRYYPEVERAMTPAKPAYRVFSHLTATSREDAWMMRA